MATDFQEFLRQKTAGSDVRERHRARAEWLGALARLLDRVEQGLRTADPEGLIEMIRYEVQRGESRLGIYDAPALKVRLNAEEVDVLPIGLHSIGPLSPATRTALAGVLGEGVRAAGRIDITDGERKYMTFRDANNGPERWFVVDNKSEASLLDQARLEVILRDLWE